MLDDTKPVLGLVEDQTRGAPPGDADPFDEVRARVREAAGADGIAMTKVAEQAGVAYGTFSSFMVGSYKGRNDEVARKARQWLDARDERARTRSALPAGVGFVRTPSADDFWRAFGHAQHAPDFVCIAGGAGMGKTSTAQHYADSSPNVWIMTAEPVMTSPHGMLSELAELLGVAERAADRRSRAILHRLRNTSGLLIVDEAQHLTSRTLDQLRSIHDLAGIGVALVGNESVYARLEGEGRRPQFAQLFSRIGMRITRSRPTPGDVEAMLEAWRVDAEARPALRLIARKPGALRGLTKVLRLAHMQASAAREAVSQAHVRLAWTMLGDGQAVGDAD